MFSGGCRVSLLLAVIMRLILSGVVLDGEAGGCGAAVVGVDDNCWGLLI
jgi:hypothetical protein